MKKITGLLLLPFFWSACGDAPVDVVPPAMQFLNLQPQPVAMEVCGVVEDSVFQLLSGDTLSFDVLFSDDVALSQYKIDIHQNFDCHGHGGGAAPGGTQPQVSNQTTDWAVLEIIDLSGTQQTETKSMLVPENVTAGIYHFQVQVIDESGNDNPLANIYSLRLLNTRDTIAPELMLTQPSQTSLSAARGSAIQFAGEVTDNYSLSEGGNGLVFVSYTDLSTSNTFLTPAVILFDDEVGESFSFDMEVVIPQTLKPGNYRYSVWTFDGVRNVAVPKVFEVTVTL